MKAIAIAAAIASLGVGVAYAGSPAVVPANAPAANQCLSTFEIKRTEVASDERAITFYMKNGRTYVNTLPAQCRGLNLHGFSYVSRTTNEVCAGQGIKLVQSGTVCELGQFAEGAPQEGSSY